MNKLDITFVRIYLTESEGLLEDLLKRLHDEEKVQGVTCLLYTSDAADDSVLV